MNNKQVPEEKEFGQKLERLAAECFTPMKNKEGEPYTQLVGQNPNGWRKHLNSFKKGYMAAMQENTPNPAYLQKEVSTPDGKDKPAMSSGKGLEERKKRVAELYEANRPKFHDWGTLKDMCIATAIQYADEYATLRQPVGTVYVPCGDNGEVPEGAIWFAQKNVWLKPIQFMPEREGVMKVIEVMNENRALRKVLAEITGQSIYASIEQFSQSTGTDNNLK